MINKITTKISSSSVKLVFSASGYAQYGSLFVSQLSGSGEFESITIESSISFTGDYFGSISAYSSGTITIDNLVISSSNLVAGSSVAGSVIGQ